jgi:hypothetical protein
MLTSPEPGTFLSSEGVESEAMTPGQFGALMRLETERWTKVAHEESISIDWCRGYSAGQPISLAVKFSGFIPTENLKCCA